MTESLYRRSIESGELKFNFWTATTYYSLVVGLTSMPVIIIVFYLTGQYPVIDGENVLAIIIPFVLAVVVYKVAKGMLKFTTINCSIKADILRIYLHQFCAENKWTIEEDTDSVFIINDKRELWKCDYGSQISLLKDGDKLYINCIDVPYKGAAIFSSAKNDKRVKMVISYLQENENNI